ncbi:MAG: methyl-accepting chemotaxis protein [Lachnospiraceae bacterium]|nr:methyl-accepting chemotaxis protein [Lachnospiraceae bacterium]
MNNSIKTVRAKLMLMVIPLAVVSLIVMIIYSLMLNKTYKEAEEIFYDELYSMNNELVSADRDFYQAYVAEIMLQTSIAQMDPATIQGYLDDITENSTQVQEHVDSVVAMAKADPAMWSFSSGGGTMASFSQMFYDEYSNWQNSIDTESGEGNLEVHRGHFANARDAIDNMEKVVEEYAKVEKESLEKQLMVTIIALLVGVLVAYGIIAVFVVMVIKYIRVNITIIIQKIETLANNDLTGEIVPLKSKDEIGRLSRAAAKLKDELTKDITALGSTSAKLTEASGIMERTTDETSSSMSNIDSAVGELATTATQTATDIENVSREMNGIQSMTEQSIESTGKLSGACDEIHDITNKGMKIVDGLTSVTNQSVEAFESIFRALELIDERTKEISTASDLIASIATQTNLLSLNASIEAARAGEAGRGFAVVATEIGSLAEQSGQSAQTINSMLDELVKSANNASEESERVRKFVDQQKNAVDETRISFESIVGNIDTVNSGVSELNGINSELGRSVDSVMGLVESLSAASEQNAATAQQLSATMTTVSTSVNEMSEMGKNVYHAAEDVGDIAKSFKL